MNNSFFTPSNKKLTILLLCFSLLCCSKDVDTPIVQTKVLVVIAHEGESDYMPTDDRIEVIYTGIGKLNAALKVSNYLKAQVEGNTNYIILNIGTCGSPNYPIGSLVIPNKIYQGDTFVEEDFQDHTSAYTNDILSLSFYKDARKQILYYQATSLLIPLLHFIKNSKISIVFLRWRLMQ